MYLINCQGKEWLRKMEKTNVKPFGMKDKIGYMFGDFGNDFTFLLSSLLMMKFYTDVMGVSAALVGTVMMVARFVDAFTDVTMGQIVDRSKPTKAGKFKPWLLRACGPVAVASVLVYASWFKDMPMMFKIVWMFFSYILWGSVCYTAINIPYGSMASAISSDPDDRQSLSTFRTIGSLAASMVINVVAPMVIYDAVGDVKVLNGTKSTIFAVICSIGAVVCYLICYNMCTERVKVEQKTEKFSLGKLVNSLIHNKALIGIVVASICQLLVQLTCSAMSTYIYPDYFGDTTWQALSGVIVTIPMLLMSVVVGKLVKKFGKKELAVVGALFGAAVYAIAFFIHTDSAAVYTILYAVAYIGLAAFSLTGWSMITDVIDDTEVQTGVRSDGEVYSIYSFARKLGQAASSGVTGLLLTMIGYQSGSTVGQTEAVRDGIYNISCLVPTIGFVLLALIMMFLYPLSKKRVEENVKILAERRK